MDFVEGFPRINGKAVISTVVNHFSKYAHFVSLGHPYTTTSVACAVFDEIVRLPGMPSSIVSDRDPVFTSKFWQELFHLTGVKLHLSSAFHPQSDGQSEATNKVITMYLRCLAGDRPRHWLQWLPWVEYCYNSSFHSSLRSTPFRVVYDRDPSPLLPYSLDVRLLAVHQQLLDHDDFLMQARERLEQTQHHYKLHHDRKHRDLQFNEGDWVWLCLLHHTVMSLKLAGRGKMGPKFFRPFQVIGKVGDVAYKL
jgi:hypothetical protein